MNLETEDMRKSIQIWLILLWYLSSYFVIEEMKTDYRFSFHKKRKQMIKQHPPYTKSKALSYIINKQLDILKY